MYTARQARGRGAGRAALEAFSQVPDGLQSIPRSVGALRRPCSAPRRVCHRCLRGRRRYHSNRGAAEVAGIRAVDGPPEAARRLERRPRPQSPSCRSQGQGAPFDGVGGPGRRGIVLKARRAPYAPEQRSRAWLKVKHRAPAHDARAPGDIFGDSYKYRGGKTQSTSAERRAAHRLDSPGELPDQRDWPRTRMVLVPPHPAEEPDSRHLGHVRPPRPGRERSLRRARPRSPSAAPPAPAPSHGLGHPTTA